MKMVDIKEQLKGAGFDGFISVKELKEDFKMGGYLKRRAFIKYYDCQAYLRRSCRKVQEAISKARNLT